MRRSDLPTTLLFDADDTLWHNNFHFERAIEEFLDFLDHSTLTRTQARAALDEIEHANTVVHGYGARAFTRSLAECFQHLSERHLSESDLQTVKSFGERILSAKMELVEGVEETLTQLARRHRLVLVTKGHPEEQQMKIDRSGLAHFFTHHEIVSEKDVSTYRGLVERLMFDIENAWMIGNSPKSDIHPALAAGLNAVFIPHEHTWRLEHAGIDESHARLLILERFTQLLDHF